MTTDPNLGFVLVADAQNQKVDAFNTNDRQLSDAMNAALSLTFIANARTLTATEFTHYHNFKCGTSLSATGTLTVPLTPRNFTLDNSLNSGHPIVVKGTAGATATLDASATSEFKTDGTNVTQIGVAGTAIAGTILGTDNTFTARQAIDPHTLTSAATIAVDLALSNNFELTLTNSGTLAFPTNMKKGTSGMIIVNQDSVGSRTLALASGWKKPGGSIAAFSTAAGSKDILSFYCDTTITALVMQILNFS